MIAAPEADAGCVRRFVTLLREGLSGPDARGPVEGGLTVLMLVKVGRTASTRVPLIVTVRRRVGAEGRGLGAQVREVGQTLRKGMPRRFAAAR
ncbi:hypothetical protein GCM10010191_87880 [Actinomadura vinacea]|uniref:Uncharacterized protein n=1 Tax=Actinomadura vinacea TaxID=115336 RepID=A0ABN3KBZ5_9ACTN